MIWQPDFRKDNSHFRVFQNQVSMVSKFGFWRTNSNSVNFQVYTGLGPDGQREQHQGDRVVRDLISMLQGGYSNTIDNVFTEVALAKEQKQNNYTLLCTMRKSKKDVSPAWNQRSLSTFFQVSASWMTDNGLIHSEEKQKRYSSVFSESRCSNWRRARLLGPTFCSIYNNDLRNKFKDTGFLCKLYADYVKLYCFQTSSETQLLSALDKVAQWSHIWLQLATEKCQAFFHSVSQKEKK